MKIAYVMSRFPLLSETFILREMEMLRASGVEVALYPLLIERHVTMHAEARRWLAEARCVPYASVVGVAHGLSWLARRPDRVVGSLARTVAENAASPKFLARALALFPKALDAAARMRQEGVQHIHAHYATHPALFAWLIHRLTGIPYSVTVHAHDIFVERAMLATKLRDAAFVVAISEFNVAWLAEHVGEWVREKTSVVRCGVEPGRYAAERTPSAGGATRILSIGSLQPYKGQAVLVRACAALKERGLDVRCRIVGEGAERGRLEALIGGLGLSQSVLLVGALPQDAVAEELRAADLYVQPSVIDATGKMEGIPVALMEAMASGLPVVATRLSGIPELVRDGETGLLVDAGDAGALAESVADLVADPARGRALAQAGRRLVAREYDLRTNVGALLRSFERQARERTVRPEQRHQRSPS